MSDREEPPTKVTRYEMSSQFLEGEVEEDGHEEWLSEGILTDDDFNPTAEQDNSASNFDTSQDGTMASVTSSIENLTDSQDNSGQNITADRQTGSLDGQNVSMDGQNVSIGRHSVRLDGQRVSISGQKVSAAKNSSSKVQTAVLSGIVKIGGRLALSVDGRNPNVNVTQDFEEALKNLEESQHNQSDLPEDLNAFLIRKKDGKIITGGNPELEADDKQSDIEESPKHSDAEDDGNDTDGLLRVLGDDDGKNKKDQDDDTADEDDFLEGARRKNLRSATSALIARYPAAKAVSEDDDITDASSDEEVVVKKMYSVQKKVIQPPKVYPARATNTKTSSGQANVMETSTPLKQYIRKPAEGSKVLPKRGQSINRLAGAAGISLVGTTAKNPVSTTKVFSTSKLPQTTKGPFHGIGTRKNIPKKPLPQPNATSLQVKAKDPNATSLQLKVKTDQGRNKTEQSGDDVNPPRPSEYQQKTNNQLIMKPEEMDEEMPSDMESETDEESLYDELPSSEDEGLNEWFTLDIRAERAGDYVPLLGEKAEKLLLEEKQRVSTRLDNLQKSLSALTETSRQQANKLRKATAELSELDAQIKAA